MKKIIVSLVATAALAVPVGWASVAGAKNGPVVAHAHDDLPSRGAPRADVDAAIEGGDEHDIGRFALPPPSDRPAPGDDATRRTHRASSSDALEPAVGCRPVRRGGVMLAESMEDFVNGLVSWLPTKLEHVAEIAVYMVFLTILLAVPFILWLGYAVSTTRRQQRGE